MSGQPANRLLAEALEAHGGLDRWRKLEGLSSTIVSGGQLWGIKGVAMPPIPRSATTEFRRQWMSVTPFGEPDWTMTWLPERVVIDASDGSVIAERDQPRDAFAGHGYDTPWDPLHLAYFNGYAMWLYHSAPFILAEPGYRVTDLAPIEHEGETLRGISALFPADVHTHSREQHFYFANNGLLRRHEYHVDVWAGTNAAHMLSDYVEVDGFQLPTRRRVYPRNPDGSLQADVNIVAVDQSDYAYR
ncbi:hypothetical protein [Novosphingobium sp. 9U]|uniref:hypothetical protein n=1 Tax=Novosphingobium sp. 9U TaxID=2653158 RepID=UPI0012F20CA4|nr:hypothetical protein [Novosphingobium sp. 9U]VWX51162.1 conserved hypothetical protein [Novosphingobium sp. 9U]